MPLADYLSIDSKVRLQPQPSDPWFFTNCSINPYRGCQFACDYCDGRASYYNIPDFGSVVRSKNDFPRYLEKELIRLGYERQSGKKQTTLMSFVSNDKKNSAKRNKKFVLSVGGGVTDCYQPLEKEFKVMRKIIKLLIDYQIPGFFLTKSTLIERDLDLIGELHDRCHASVNFSCAFKDGPDKTIHEPASPSIARRFETLKKFTSAGIPGGVLAMPILPYIADTDETLEYLVSSAKESRASYMITSGLTLKPGNREVFFAQLKTHYPQLLTKYEHMFPENNTYGFPTITADSVNVTAKAHVLCKEYDIYPRVKRYVPEGYNSDNFKFSEKLWYVHYLKKWVLQDCSYSLDKDFKELTTNIDSFHLSITSLSTEEFSYFIKNHTQYLQNIALELFETGKSKELIRLEELALKI